MTWFKVDDGFWSHPKVLLMSAEATSLWVRAGAYSCQHLTDGRIDAGLLSILGNVQAAEELVRNGLWCEVDGGYEFHDWDEYQETSETVKRRRDANRDRKRKQRRTTSGQFAESPVDNGVSHAGVTRDGLRDGLRDGAESHGARLTVPTRPDPTLATDVAREMSATADAAPRADVDELCERLRSAVAGRVTKAPTVTKAWRDSARLLLDRDGVAFDDAVRVLDWSQSDEFWAGNVLSMPTFRKQFAKLEIQSRRAVGRTVELGGGATVSQFPTRPTASDRAREHLGTVGEAALLLEHGGF